MRTGYSGPHIVAAEQPLLAAGVPLMARAAFGLSVRVRRLLAGSGRPLAGARIAVLVGPGNNGGDALFAAAHLAKLPIAVTVYLAHDRAHTGGLAALSRTNAHISRVTAANVGELARAAVGSDLLLDALLGLGATGPARGLVGTLVRALNTEIAVARAADRPRAKIVAVDLPTGVDASTGQIAGPDATVWADHTVTFGALKTGLLVGPGALAAGRVELVDIGLVLDPEPGQVQSLDRADLTRLGIAARPPVTNHKFTAGVVGQITGSARYPGAAVMTAHAALKSGAGLVRCVGAPELIAEVRRAHPEIVGGAGRVGAWVLGSGVAPGSRQEARIASLLAESHDPHVGIVIDAGALAVSAHHRIALDPLCVLTPHAGELAQLLSTLTGKEVTRHQVESNPLKWARLAQELTGATVVLKGPVTLICGPGVTLAQDNGTPRLATAGSGDVLAGLLGSLLAQHLERLAHTEHHAAALIAAAGVALHGQAGRLAAGELTTGGAETASSRPIAASDVCVALPDALSGD